MRGYVVDPSGLIIVSRYAFDPYYYADPEEAEEYETTVELSSLLCYF